ncbi:Detected protein of unknown function [Hibiscus syriacus]|uniref:Histidine kinase/HSP90-like ATPase domain-containing protein n=1 Tax=Hibiscus syriacus TaxID=106335 RepID=A0A6A2XIU1_HIBSY|nr:Detected protein of unknown function [Hibiscus syriacus]
MPQSSGVTTTPVLPSNETLESRSFWKAGNYVFGPSSKPALLQGSLEHARVHPKFLHSNATSHKWAFGAIAEIMDNAVDEIQHGATFIKVDKIDVMKDNSPGPALLFLDDGGGMDPALIRKCMSLGYSSKKSNTTIGQYGNGFKTSTMRLGPKGYTTPLTVTAEPHNHRGSPSKAPMRKENNAQDQRLQTTARNDDLYSKPTSSPLKGKFSL